MIAHHKISHMAKEEKQTKQVRWELPDDLHRRIAIHQKKLARQKKEDLSMEDAAIDLLDKATENL